MSDIKIAPLNFSVIINANTETVWHKMLDLEGYKVWSREFDISKTSFYEGSWDLGEKILFRTDADKSGIAGEITKNEYTKVVEITYHTWIDKDGQPDTSEDSKAMAGLVERYTFTSISEGETKLEVYLETLESYSEFMADLWPKALAKLKEICEN